MSATVEEILKSSINKKLKELWRISQMGPFNLVNFYILFQIIFYDF